MLNNHDSRTHLPWPQIALLLIGLALLLALLLGRVPPARPKVILPQNVATLREFARFETNPTQQLRDVRLSSTDAVLTATTGYVNYLWRLDEGTAQITDLQDSGGYVPQMLPDDPTVAVFLNWSGRMSLLDMTSSQTLQRFDGHQTSSLQNWAFNRTADRLAISSMETLMVLDVATREPQFVLTAPAGRTFHHSYPVFSADSTLLATIYRYSDCRECEAELVVWDAITGEQRALLGPFTGGSATALAFSDDNQLLAVGGLIWKDVGADSMYQLWNLDTGTELILRRVAGHAIEEIIISPDNQLLAARDGDGVWLWRVDDLITGGPPLVDEHGNGSTQRFDGIAFSPDYRLFAYGTPTGIIRVVDTDSGALLAELRGHHQDLLDLRFSADGRLLISSGYDHTIRLWALDDPGFAASFHEQPGTQPTPYFTPTPVG